MSAQAYDFAYVVRKDSSVLRRTCWVGLADTGAQTFLDHRANVTFAPGESLIAWANVPLVTDQQALRPQPVRHVLGVAVQRGPDQAAHRLRQPVGQACHEPPVDDPEAPVVEDQEVAGVRVRVQDAGSVRS